ncbi:hypothetical protein [Streptomyces cyaneofuscatus]|uniref:hypothetical protein n=1 Tax=Streptomyces cyaneofuscatus TaxID=66883 RepID=UPI003802752E
MADTALAAVDGGRFHRRHLLAEARRHLAPVLRGRRRDPGLDDQIVAAAISTHCRDITEPKTVHGLEVGYRFRTARRPLSDIPARRRPTAAPDPDRRSPADPGEPPAPRPPGQDAGEWETPRVPLQYDRAVLVGAAVREQLCTTTTGVARAGPTTSSPTSRRRCPSSCSRPSRPTRNTTTMSRSPAAARRWT